MKYRPYKKELDYSYTVGAYPTIELLTHRQAEIVYVSEKASPDLRAKIDAVAGNTPIEVNDKAILRLSGDQGALVAGVFMKYQSTLNPADPHVVLARPDDMGNLGTIIRSMVGLGYTSLAIIKPSLDHFNPKVIRSSTGAVFLCNVVYFDSLEAYQTAFPNHQIYAFALDRNATPLRQCKFASKHALLFGNEGSGLSESEVNLGQTVFIEQSDQIDSLNLGVAVSIAMYQAK